MPRLANQLKKLRRRRNNGEEDGIVADNSKSDQVIGCCGCLSSSRPSRKHHDDDGSVMTADTTLSGASTLPYKDDMSPCEDLGYLIGDAAVTLLDGFAAVMNCCSRLTVKPNQSHERTACCTTITWGPDEVRYMEAKEELEDVEEDESDTRLIETKSGNNERERSSSPEWEDFGHFEVNQENIEVWTNDTEEQQKMIEAAFSTDFSDFSSFVAPRDVSIEEVSIESNAPNALSGKKKRACACCGKSNTKDAPVKLKVCSRCKTSYYCSAGKCILCVVNS